DPRRRFRSPSATGNAIRHFPPVGSLPVQSEIVATRTGVRVCSRDVPQLTPRISESSRPTRGRSGTSTWSFGMSGCLGVSRLSAKIKVRGGTFGDRRRIPRGMTDAQVSPARRWAITLSVMMVTVMQVLDTSVTNVALPHMQGSLSAGIEEMSWVLTSYLAANAVAIPATGWLSARFGRRRFFLICTVLYTASSFLSGIAFLQLVLDLGEKEDWFDSRLIVALAVLAVCTLAGFLLRELTVAEPILDLTVFNDRNFAVGILCIALVGLGFNSSMLLIALYTQKMLGYDAWNSGLVLAPGGFGTMLALMVSGRLVSRMDQRLMLGGGCLL